MDDLGDSPVGRRALLASCAAGAGALAGCTFDPSVETATGTTTGPGVRGTLALTVANEDVDPHGASVEVRDGSGRVLEGHTLQPLSEGERRRLDIAVSGDTRYAVEVIAVGRRLGHTWQARPCPELAYEVVIERGGTARDEARCP